MRLIGILIIGLVLQACSTSRYQQDIDSTPVYREIIGKLPEPAPVREPLSRRGNADSYQVWGKTYHVQKSLKQYQATGVASWYGQKFHGHETSNGERFDVYKFTAAHKSLPLPSYVRVTNTANQKSLIVRVNDRGPFHGNRLIDLSYAAAVRLDFADSGTADVKIELIAAPITKGDHLFMQVGAFQAEASARKLKKTLALLVAEPVYIRKYSSQGKTLHKVQIGPMMPARVSVIQTTLKQQKLQPGHLLH